MLVARAWLSLKEGKALCLCLEVIPWLPYPLTF